MPARSIRQALLLLLLLVPAAARAEPAFEPRRLTRDLNAAILGVMKEAEELGYEGRYLRLAPVMSRIFDFAGMTRVAAGRFLDEIPEPQRAVLSEELARVTIGSFASLFNGYRDHRFDIVRVDPGPGGAVLVRTRLLSPTRDPIPIGYMFYERGGAWKVYDVYIGLDMSLLSLRRSEYASILLRSGVEGLVGELRQKVAVLGAGRGPR